MTLERKKILCTAGFLILFLLLCNSYYYKLLFTGPSYVHAWAQGDRFSLAVNFYDNGMNFFLPATSNLTSENGITGVEFPIQAYLAAALAHIFGRENISICFKLVTLIISLTGLYFLFLSVYKRTRDFVLSIATPIFFFCSPVFIFYTCNYLPDTAGASFAFMSFYFILDYFENGTRKSCFAALSLLMLASLIKTSVAVYLLAFIGHIFFSMLSKKNRPYLKKNTGLFFVSLLFILPVIGYYFYNQYLNQKYAPVIFMSKPLPFKSWNSFMEYANGAFKFRWMYDYLALPQYLMAASVIAPGLYLLRNDQVGKKHLLLLALFLPGALAMFYLLGEQFGIHDYYIIAILFPLLAYALVVSVIHLHRQAGDVSLRSLRISFAAALLISFIFGSHQYSKRFGEPTDIYRWAVNGAEVMDQLGISKKEPIMLLNEYPSNLALTYFDRRGYNFYYEGYDYSLGGVIQDLARKNVKVIVMRAEVEQRVKEKDPAGLSRFDHLITKDELAVYRLRQAD